MGTKAGSGISGYKYYLSFFAGVCRGSLDAIIAFKFGDIYAWAGNVTGNTTITINQPNLFGGDEKEGGIVGTIQAFFGGEFQVLPGTVKDSLNDVGLVAPDSEGGGVIIPGSGLVPEYRGVTTFFFKGQVSANNPYLKPFKMRCRRTMKGWQGDVVWYAERAIVPLSSNNDGALDIAAMNPVHVLYECHTNSLWGRGLSTTLMSDATWKNAADICFNEGIGVCLKYNRQSPLSEFMKAVADHIDCAVFLDRRTGTFKIKLFRGGYDPATLPHFDANSGLLKIEDDQAGSNDNQANEIIVKWHDPIQDKDRQTRAQNLASIQSQGAVVSTTVTYEGCPTSLLAGLLATRDLLLQASALKRYKISFDRAGARLAPGDVFRISDLTRGLANIVLRVATIVEDGPKDSDGGLVLSCIQDVFGMPATSIVGIQQPLWTDLNKLPTKILRQTFQEVSYRDLVLSLTEAELAEWPFNLSAVFAAASKPNVASLTYELWTKAGTEPDYVRRTVGDFCASARIQDFVILPLQTEFTVYKGVDWDLISIGSGALIDNEWVKVVAFDPTTGEIEVARGCVDTLPAAHATETVVFFADDHLVSDGRQYSATEVVDAVLLTVTSSGILDISDADELSLEIKGRPNRPYPMANLKVSSPSGPVSVFLIDPGGAPADDKVFTWNQRNRLTQLDELVGHTAGSVVPEVGTTYRFRIYTYDPLHEDDPGTLLRTESGITGTTWTYTTVMQSADGPTHVVRIEAESLRDGVSSFYKYSFLVPLLHAGWGYGWGLSWGIKP